MQPIDRKRARVSTAPRRPAVVALFLAFLACAALTTPSAQSIPPTTPADYAADEKCLSCHQDKKPYLGTAHNLTSKLATKDSIAGQFREGENTLKTSNPDLSYKMEATKDGFFQMAVLGTPPDTATFSRRFDFVIGSGRKGQTYLYWAEENRLCELPVSYWTELGKWVNSPGYPDGELNFGRPVPARCLECHATSFEPIPGTVNRFDKTNFILGISCGKCHGPGREHVELRLARAAPSPGPEIVNPTKLARAREIEVCAVCHGGLGVQTAPAFSFVPGKPLQDYLQLRPPGPDEAVDVHGNQIALLERSRCFQASTMTCSTCHDVHLPQRDAPAYSTTCLTCHKVESCGMHAKMGRKIADNCVDCHMPKLTSNVIVSVVEGRKVQPQVRTHWIKVYPGRTGP